MGLLRRYTISYYIFLFFEWLNVTYDVIQITSFLPSFLIFKVHPFCSIDKYCTSFVILNSVPNVGLELTTPRLRVTCFFNWASQMLFLIFKGNLHGIYVNNVYESLIFWGLCRFFFQLPGFLILGTLTDIMITYTTCG